MNEKLELLLFYGVLLIFSCAGHLLLKKLLGKPLKPNKSSVFTLLFIAYLCAVATLTMIPSHRFSLNQTIAHINMIPVIESYRQMIEMLQYGSPLGVRMFFQNLFGNIIMFIPFGAFATLLYKMRKRDVILWALVFSITLEFTQFAQRWIGYFRHVDIDDVLLNVTGALIGFVLYKLAKRSNKYFRFIHKETAIDSAL